MIRVSDISDDDEGEQRTDDDDGSAGFLLRGHHSPLAAKPSMATHRALRGACADRREDPDNDPKACRDHRHKQVENVTLNLL
jgi:hypothetical protein